MALPNTVYEAYDLVMKALDILASEFGISYHVVVDKNYFRVLHEGKKFETNHDYFPPHKWRTIHFPIGLPDEMYSIIRETMIALILSGVRNIGGNDIAWNLDLRTHLWVDPDKKGQSPLKYAPMMYPLIHSDYEEYTGVGKDIVWEFVTQRKARNELAKKKANETQ